MRKTRKFKRQCFWYKKLGDKWRKPRGRQSKLRREKKGRWAIPKIGYGNPSPVENKIAYGNARKTPVIVKNLKDLALINPKEDIGIIASSVGNKKSQEILKKAKELGLPIKNRKLKKAKEIKAKTAEKK